MAQMTQYEIEGLWIENRLDVAYRFDDAVCVKSGEREGETGRIVALYKLEPFPHYVIEFPDGRSVAAVEADIEHVI
jgi:hypothetical protein